MAKRLALLLMILIAASAAHPSKAQGVFAGRWTVVGEQPAPWLKGDKTLKALPEAALAKATIVFRADAVEAPSPLGCRGTHHKIENVPPEGLFEGGLDDPDRGMTDAKGAAAALGFKSDSIPTLESGCAEMNYHMVDPDTLLFALDNVIYTLKRAR